MMNIDEHSSALVWEGSCRVKNGCRSVHKKPVRMEIALKVKNLHQKRSKPAFWLYIVDGAEVQNTTLAC